MARESKIRNWLVARRVRDDAQLRKMPLRKPEKCNYEGFVALCPVVLVTRGSLQLLSHQIGYHRLIIL